MTILTPKIFGVKVRFRFGRWWVTATTYGPTHNNQYGAKFWLNTWHHRMKRDQS